MLVLSRKVGEKLVVGDHITVVVQRVKGNRVTIGIDAPNDVRIVRGELQPFESKDQTPIARREPAFLTLDLELTDSSYASRASR